MGGGRSTKLGNVLLNFRSLFDYVGEGVVLGFSTTGPRWVMVLAGLVILNKLRSSLGLNISEREAIVLWTMWHHRDHNEQIVEDSLLGFVNSELASKGRPKLGQHEIEVSLEALLQLRCIERVASISGNWRLRESVRVSYS